MEESIEVTQCWKGYSSLSFNEYNLSLNIVYDIIKDLNRTLLNWQCLFFVFLANQALYCI